MLYVGIDPGFASGAVTLISNDTAGGKVMKCSDFAFEKSKGKNEIDARALYDVLYPLRHRIKVVTLEQISGMPNQSSSTTFKTGGGYYTIQAVVKIARLPLIFVSSNKWKKFYNLGRDKGDSLQLARQFYPDVDLSKKKDHNRAESLLIARYGMYLYGELKK